jgi:hypothetical protein
MGESVSRRFAALIIVVLAVVVAGCGGGGSRGTTVPTTPVQFSLGWADRSRATQGPSSALSASITLSGANPTGGDFVASVNRNAAPGAYTQSYMSANAAKVGTFLLTVRFFGGANATGAVVASGQAIVTIQSNGSGIGDITVANKVASVTVDASQTVTVSQNKQLTFTARDSQSAIVAVSPGSAFWTQVDGAAFMSVTQDGIATGIAVGTSNVSVSVDGVASAATPVLVQVSSGFQALGGPGPGSGVGQFNQPNEVAFNAAGTKMYVTDGLNNRLIEVNVSGTLDTSGWASFGSAGSGVNQFGGAAGRIGDVAVDATGRIYITDPGNNRIVRIDNMSGAGWTTFGTAGSGVGQFMLASGIALDAAGRIYVTDESANRVIRIDDMTGANWAEMGPVAGGSGVGEFDSPTSIAIRNTGAGEKIYVTDRDNNRVVQMTDIAGGGWTAFGTGGQIQDQPGGVSIDSTGRIYFTQFFRNRIVRIDTIGGAGFTTYGSPGSGTDQLQNPFATSIDTSNRIYITDRNNHRLVRIDQIP